MRSSVSGLAARASLGKQPSGLGALAYKSFSAGHFGINREWAVNLKPVALAQCLLCMHAPSPDAKV
jgi:hypothetical protein